LAVKYRQLGIQPLELADKQTLIRRLFIDLLGVPPKPNEVRQFNADDSPNAYEKLVDRLLTRPEYGERWGRHWMDVWRYSDWYGRSMFMLIRMGRSSRERYAFLMRSWRPRLSCTLLAMHAIDWRASRRLLPGHHTTIPFAATAAFGDAKFRVQVVAVGARPTWSADYLSHRFPYHPCRNPLNATSVPIHPEIDSKQVRSASSPASSVFAVQNRCVPETLRDILAVSPRHSSETFLQCFGVRNRF
jgi:Protein of unknown function (DUF1549)